MRILRNILLAVVFTIVGIILLMLIPSPQPDAVKPWDVTVMPDNNVKILGIHLGQTDYKTAQQQLREFGRTALFTDPDNRQGVEAFFDNINLGGLSAKLVLNIDVPEQELNKMLERAGPGKLQPSGARQYELMETDREQLLQMPVVAMVYAPSARLTEEMVVSRFGEPANKLTTDANANGVTGETWHYPDIAMTVVFEPSQKPVLMFQTKAANVD